MKFFKLMKDGGGESKVRGFFAVEIKKLFSIVLLHFSHGSREAYHTHAFHSISWVLKGKLNEFRMNPDTLQDTLVVHKPSFLPVFTSRWHMHMVQSVGDTFVLSFRGPWMPSWMEYLPQTKELVLLTHGRVELTRKTIDSLR